MKTLSRKLHRKVPLSNSQTPLLSMSMILPERNNKMSAHSDHPMSMFSHDHKILMSRSTFTFVLRTNIKDNRPRRVAAQESTMMR